MPSITSALARAIALFALATAGASTLAAEAAYPVRPVRLVVGFGVGGGVDTLARMIAPKLAEAMGYTWVVDNRTGASGNISTELVVRGNPDGQTLHLDREAFARFITAETKKRSDLIRANKIDLGK